MTESLERQRCFEYLLDSMEAGARLRFEAQLTFDEQLAGELRSCESELAAFAEASAPRLAPSPAVWDGIVAELSAAGSVDKDPIWARIPWTKLAWPVAACALLGLNFWQFVGFSPDSASDGADLAEERGFGGRTFSPSAEATEQHLRAEIESLRRQVGNLERTLTVEAREADRATAVTQIHLLRERRDELRERIEFLESYYIALAELSGIAGGILSTGAAIEDQLGVEFAYSQNLLLGGAGGGIWERVAEGLRDAPLVTLAMSANHGWNVGGNESFRPFGAWSGVVRAGSDPTDGVAARNIDPYAFAFIDRDSGQAILTLGDLPRVESGEQMVLWTRGIEEEGYRQVSALPLEFSGQSVNLGVRLPEGISQVSDFLVTIETETNDGEGSLTQPGERIVLQTVPSP